MVPHWKLDSGGMIENSVELFFVLSCDFFVVVPDILLSSVLSISTVFNVLIIVVLGMQTLSYVALSMGIFRDFGYLWLILWTTAKRLRLKGI